MKKTKFKIISFILSIVVIISQLPLAVLATENDVEMKENIEVKMPSEAETNCEENFDEETISNEDGNEESNEVDSIAETTMLEESVTDEESTEEIHAETLPWVSGVEVTDFPVAPLPLVRYDDEYGTQLQLTKFWSILKAYVYDGEQLMTSGENVTFGVRNMDNGEIFEGVVDMYDGYLNTIINSPLISGTHSYIEEGAPNTIYYYDHGEIYIEIGGTTVYSAKAYLLDRVETLPWVSVVEVTDFPEGPQPQVHYDDEYGTQLQLTEYWSILNASVYDGEQLMTSGENVTYGVRNMDNGEIFEDEFGMDNGYLKNIINSPLTSGTHSYIEEGAPNTIYYYDHGEIYIEIGGTTVYSAKAYLLDRVETLPWVSVVEVFDNEWEPVSQVNYDDEYGMQLQITSDNVNYIEAFIHDGEEFMASGEMVTIGIRNMDSGEFNTVEVEVGVLDYGYVIIRAPFVQSSGTHSYIEEGAPNTIYHYDHGEIYIEKEGRTIYTAKIYLLERAETYYTANSIRNVVFSGGTANITYNSMTKYRINSPGKLTITGEARNNYIAVEDAMITVTIQNDDWLSSNTSSVTVRTDSSGRFAATVPVPQAAGIQSAYVGSGFRHYYDNATVIVKSGTKKIFSESIFIYARSEW